MVCGGLWSVFLQGGYSTIQGVEYTHSTPSDSLQSLPGSCSPKRRTRLAEPVASRLAMRTQTPSSRTLVSRHVA